MKRFKKALRVAGGFAFDVVREGGNALCKGAAITFFTLFAGFGFSAGAILGYAYIKTITGA